jgi:hypothetical protein
MGVQLVDQTARRMGRPQARQLDVVDQQVGHGACGVGAVRNRRGPTDPRNTAVRYDVEDAVVAQNQWTTPIGERSTTTI